MYSVNQLIRKLARKISRKVLRCIVSLSYDDKGIQRLQVKALNGDVYEMPHIQQYGCTSRPKDGAEGVLLMLDDAQGIVIGVDDARYRLKPLEKGEVALYDDEGSKIHLKRGGHIHHVASTKITFEAPLAEFTGDIKAQGDITDRSDANTNSMNAMRDIYNDHDHPETNSTTQKPNQQMT